MNWRELVLSIIWVLLMFLSACGLAGLILAAWSIPVWAAAILAIVIILAINHIGDILFAELES